MGHSHPGVTFFSYVHFLGEIADRFTCVAPGKDWPSPGANPKNASWLIDLSVLPCSASRAQRSPIPRHELGPNDVLGILVDLDRGVALDALSARYAVERAALERISVVSGKVRSHLRTFAAPRRATSTAAEGIMSHVLASAYPRLGQQLAKLFTPQARERISAIGITDAEYLAMFGSNRNISMFRLAQFLLVREILLILEVAATQIRIGVPVALSAEVRDRATRTGWLADPSSPQQSSISFTAQLSGAVKPDAVLFQGESVSQRVVLSLARSAVAPVTNRWEFVCVLLSLVPLIRFENERE